jgi:rhamnogalacturonyl hydrolase YesR
MAFSRASRQKKTMKWTLITGLFIAFCGQAIGKEEPVGPAFTPDAIVSLMRKVNEHTRANPYKETDHDWIRATYYTGVMGAWSATQDPAYLEQAKAWGEKHQWQVGGESSGYNKFFCVMTWADLFLLDKDPAKLRPTLEWIASGAPNSPALGKIWYGHGPAPYDSPLYADSLYAASVFAKLYKATGDKLYLDLLHESFWTVTEKIFDKDENLYYRDPSFMGKQTANSRKILWSRGNGWVFAGLALLLQHLPENEPQRDRYVELFRKLAVSIRAHQHDDGLWRANLGDPDDYRMPESSGTAFFTFGLAWGINAGILDRETYLPAVVRGWHGLVSCVHPDGTLGWVQPVDAQPRPSLPITTHEYATGLFLLAGSEMLKLTQAGTITPESAAKQLVPDDSILPPAATAKRAVKASEHPLAPQIQTFLDQQGKTKGFQATGLDRGDYLEVIAGQVKAMRRYQDPEGRIIDPVTQREMFYATPCYAHSVAALVTAKHPASKELLESGMQALDISILALAENRAPGKHGDFFTWPVMLAYEMFSSFATEERKETWRRGLAAIDITKVYQAYRKPYGPHEHGKFYKEYGKEWANNWNLVNAAGEFLRAGQGLTDSSYTDFCLTMQLPHFTSFGMFDESGNPLAYDLFPRHYVTGMLHRGYRSFAYSTYRDLMWRGAWTSLFMQSPFGELPTGYRSSHHIWNEAEQAVVFEIYANHYARAGRAAEAGAFKRAAHLALQSVKNWIRPDGSGYIVKNRFPIEAKHGYEGYSAHSCYNMLACSMLAQAWQFADDSVTEKPAPADTGGFVIPILDPFHKIFANAGGTYVEYDIRGDHKYNPTGLLRIHVKGGHPQLGPSDGCAPLYSGEGVNIATGPAWQEPGGQWQSLAELSPPTPTVEILEQDPARTRFRVSYALLSAGTEPAPIRLTQTILVEPSGVTVTDELTGLGERMQVTWPMLVSDGKASTQVKMSGNSAFLKLDGRGNRFTLLEPAGVILSRSGKPVPHRNGLAEAATAEFAGKRAVYRITALPQT